MFVITRLSYQLCPSYYSCNSNLSLLQVSLKLVAIAPTAAPKATATVATITQWPCPDVAPICATCANAGTGKIDNIVNKASTAVENAQQFLENNKSKDRDELKKIGVNSICK